MTYSQGQYKIEPISRTTTNLDTSKITSEVEKISSTAWVCMSKTKLVEFAEDHKAERIKLTTIARSALTPNQNTRKPTVIISTIKNIPAAISQIYHI